MGSVQAPAAIEFGRFSVLRHRREVLAEGRPIELGERAFDVLMALIEASGAVVSKDALMNRVWSGRAVEENSLQVQISALRRAFAADRDLIRTIVGRGYQFTGEIRVVPAGSCAQACAGEPQSTPMPARSLSNLPEPVSELIGRDVELDQIVDLSTSHRVVTLTGTGGIGKTRLVLEVARRVLPSFADGVWAIELAPLSDSEHVPAAVATAFGLELTSGTLSPLSVAEALRSKQLMLVLDNCEHLIEAAARMAEALLRANPAARVIATSREPLRIEGEWIYRVPPLTVPTEDRQNSEDALRYAAVRLFVERMRAAAPQFSPDARVAAAIAGICRRLDGIPLAIEFAAARAATLGTQQVASRLDDIFGLLTGGRRTALPRHQTLRATLDWSYGLLPEVEAAVLRRLAVFARDFSLAAALAVAGDLVASCVVDDVLANLVAKSLIIADLQGESAQYRLLDTTRVYALEKLRECVEFQQAARRHAEYYRDFFAQAEAESETRPQAEWLAVYGRHIDNVRAGLDWAFSPVGDPQLGVALTIAVVPLWVQLSLLGECRERVQLALASLDDHAASTARARMQLSAALGWSLMYGVGRAREAGPAWATTLELAETLDDRDYRLRALWGLCIDQFNNGEFRRALDYARRFSALAANSTDAVDLVMADRILATSLHYLGDQKNARHHIDRVLAHLTALAQKPQMIRFRFDLRVSTHYFQARILFLQGFADQALRVVEHNIEEGRAIGHALTFCSVLGQGACPIAFLAGDLDAAARYGAMLLDHTERHPVRLWHLWARCFNGMVTIKRGDIAGGLNILQGELEQAGEARFLPRFLLPLGELAACLGEAGEVTRGLATVDETLAHCKARDEGWYLAELLRIKGELLLRQAEDQSISAAEDRFGEALEVAREQGARFWELRGALSLARLRANQGRQDDAIRLLAPVYDRFTGGFETVDSRAARAMLAAKPSQRRPKAGGDMKTVVRAGPLTSL
jgi:predicted ATPase/DNA-binding winged helix-turn-helix (wHTH) protein